MSTPEKRENSVLFSLRELKQIEETRVQEEEHATKSAEEAKVRAARENERVRRETEDKRARDLADAEAARIEAAERQAREEQLRLQESETRARVEAQSKLDAARLAHEMELRRQEVSKKRPTWLIGVVAVLFVSATGLGIFLYKRDQDAKEQAAIAQKANAEADAAQKVNEKLQNDLHDLQDKQDKLEKQTQEATAAVAAATDEASRKAAQAKLDDLRAQQAAVRADMQAKSDAAAAAKRERQKHVKIDQKCIDNPLGC